MPRSSILCSCRSRQHPPSSPRMPAKPYLEPTSSSSVCQPLPTGSISTPSCRMCNPTPSSLVYQDSQDSSFSASTCSRTKPDDVPSCPMSPCLGPVGFWNLADWWAALVCCGDCQLYATCTVRSTHPTTTQYNTTLFSTTLLIIWGSSAFWSGQVEFGVVS